MKRVSIIMLLTLMTCVFTLSAQRGEYKHSFDVEKHHQEQADFYVKELGLTPTEKDAFIPLMEEYIHARYALNKEVRQAGRDLRQKEVRTSADYQKVIDLGLEAKIKEAALQKEYYQKFGKVLPAEKVLKYHRAEKKFMQRAVRHHNRDKRDSKGMSQRNAEERGKK